MAKQARRQEEQGKSAPVENVTKQDGPEFIAHGVSKTAGGYVAFRVSSVSGMEVLTPTRAGKQAESQSSAVARMTEAQRVHLTTLITGRG